MDTQSKAQKFLIPTLLLLFWFTAPLFEKPKMDLTHLLEVPLRSSFILGTDAFGRSLASLLLYSGYESLVFSLVASAITLIISFLILLTSEALFLSQSVFWFLRLLNAFPSLLLALLLKALLGGGLDSFWLAMIMGSVPHLSLLLLQTLEQLKTDESVLASKAMGANALDLLKRHYFPCIFSIFLPKWIYLISGNILAEASLTYLGIGFPPDHLSWGSLIILSKEYLLEAPQMMLICGLSLLITMASLRSLLKLIANVFSGYQSRANLME